MPQITLSQSESKSFFEIIDSELKCVINEYDSDTGRVPGKKRISEGKYAKSIIEKWINTQPKIPNSPYINMERITACTLALTDKEVSYSKHLLDKAIKECRTELSKYLKPYTGFAQCLDILQERLFLHLPSQRQGGEVAPLLVLVALHPVET